MLETITLNYIFWTIIITGLILLISIIYVAVRIEAILKYFDRQRFVSDIKSQIASELKKDVK